MHCALKNVSHPIVVTYNNNDEQVNKSKFLKLELFNFTRATTFQFCIDF